MATMIREQQGLVTIRCRLLPGRSGAMIAAEPFLGATSLAPERRLPLTALGLDPAPDSSNPLAEPGQAPDVLWDLFHNAGKLADDAPVWLQLAHGADLLAAYPWEREFSTAAGRAILRIPNFLHNSHRNEPARPIAICAAAPVAKGQPPLDAALMAVLQALTGRHRRRVVLFMAKDGRPGAAVQMEGLQIEVAPPPERPTPSPRSRGIDQRDEIASPWLTWMTEVLGPRGAQAVHFICPGYGRGAHGALALPESPTVDDDRHWARFVGASELAALLDRLDCQSVGFSAVGAARWSAGLRLLANELTWLRPGPVLLSENTNEATALTRAYRCLLHGDAFDPSPDPDLSFSVHPQALHLSDDRVMQSAATRSTQRSRAPDSRLPETISPLLRETLPPELRSRLAQLSSARPRSQVQEAQDLGALRALNFVADLMAEDDAPALKSGEEF